MSIITKGMKAKFSILLIALMVALTAIVAVNNPSINIAEAASKPTISKKSRNILVGNKYNLNINNKVAKSTYKWRSGDDKIATVNNKGIVTAKKKGVVEIVCTINTPDNNTYRVKSKITVREPAMYFKIKNKVSALNLGQEYDLNRRMSPSYSNDKTTWTTSDDTIANPDSLGKFTALKEGEVTITGTTMSGKSDSVTFTVVDKEGIVTNQDELDVLVGSGAELVTIKTDKDVVLKVKGGKHLGQTLVVDAPNADIINRGVFKAIEIKQVKADTWYERAVGNLLKILDKDTRIVIASYAKVSIEVNEENAILRIENNGKIEEIIINKNSVLDMSGDSEENVPVIVNVPNIKITTSVPLDLVCNAKIELEVLPGAENTTVKAANKDVIPTIIGDIIINVVVGDDEEEETVPGIPTTTVPGTNPGTDPQAEDAETYYILDSSGVKKKLSEISGVEVSYGIMKIELPSEIINKLKGFLLNETETTNAVNAWKAIDETITKEYTDIVFNGTELDGVVSVKISPVEGDELKKKVELPLLGSYEVKVNASNNSVTIKALSSGKIYTVKKLDEYSIKISPAPQGLSFTVPSYR